MTIIVVIVEELRMIFRTRFYMWNIFIYTSIIRCIHNVVYIMNYTLHIYIYYV